MANAKNYYRVMLGRKSKHAEECYQGQFIGTDFGIDTDLTGKLSEDWREFNKQFIPYYLKKFPDKSKITAGLACGAIHTISKGIQKGDVVLCPNGSGSYWVGEVVGDYMYRPGGIFPHRRTVRWYPKMVARSEMSQALKNSTGSIGTVSDVTKHADEIEKLLAGNAPTTLIATDDTVEDPTAFALEEHLQDFLVHNWNQTSLGQHYDIYEEDGELVGKEYPCDTGRIDIFAISKDKKTLLVVELKKGRASDVVVGQTQRYMGYVMDELAETGQSVRGVIIALEDDVRIRRALKAASNIDFYLYQVSFKLHKA